MNKLLRIAGLFLLVAMIMGCSDGTNPSSGVAQFTTTTVFNPNSTAVKLICQPQERAAATEKAKLVCTVQPKEKEDVTIQIGLKYSFTDEEDSIIADLSVGDDGQYHPVYLELNEPKDGKEYMLLNQYKKADKIESYTRFDEKGQTYETYTLKLFEVVNADDLDAYKYDDDTYIRIYPSANYWIDSYDYVANKIGTKITYDEAFRNKFEPLSNPWVAWGWSTYNSDYDIWFCHRVVSSVLHAKE